MTALGSCSPLNIIVKEILALSPALGAPTTSFEEADLTPHPSRLALCAGLLYWDMVRVYTDHIPIPRQNR